MKLKQFLYPFLCIALLIISAGAAFAVKTISGDLNYKASADDRLTIQEGTEEADVAGSIVNSVDTYLSLTSCENIDEVPAIEEAAAVTPRPVIQLTEDEIYMLACQVDCEAEDEPYEGMVGVANVIINRIKSSGFPNTLEGVLYQEGQFPPATNGSLARVMKNGPTSDCMKAAEDALYGADAVGGYLYFNMSSGVDKSSVSSYMQIGTTVFYTP